MPLPPLCRRAVQLAWLVLAPLAVQAQERVTTAQIVTNTLPGLASCLQWRVSGTCFWLFCTWFSCEVRTSMRISHYSPDVVVSTWHDLKSHPWSDWGMALETQLLAAATSEVRAPIDAAGTRTRKDRRDQNKMYRDADAIGFPLNLGSMAGGGDTTVFCPNRVQAFQPYYTSMLDALFWRAMLPLEALRPEALIPGLREVGTWPLNSWGNVFPRDGNVTQQHSVKAAAVQSQRVGDIITGGGTPHLYIQLPTGGMDYINNYLVWLPSPLIEHQPLTGTWQMVAPVPEPVCHAFGDNDSVLPASYGDGKTSSSAGYIFNLWRPYSCCSQAGQVFLGALVF